MGTESSTPLKEKNKPRIEKFLCTPLHILFVLIKLDDKKNNQFWIRISC